MKVIILVHQIGMNFKMYSRKVIMDKPFYTWRYKANFRNDYLLKDVINQGIDNYFYDHPTELNSYTKELLRFDNHYIYVKGYYYKAITEKTISEIKCDLGVRTLRIDFFIINGGASYNYEGYKFVIHPDESIHKYNPHVHVLKDGFSVRYSLKTNERFKNDTCSDSIKRDERKIIIPYLKRNHRKLMKCWNDYQKGYVTPTLDNEKKQHFW